MEPLGWWQVLVLALIQGLTEFLPISSSAHLILPAALFGWPDQGLAFDVAVHFGSLLAVLVYFRTRLADLARGGLNSLRGRHSPAGRLAWGILAATVPVGLAGFLFGDLIESRLRNLAVIATATLAGALLLALADRQKGGKSLANIGGLAVLIIGMAQALALVPGASRSGLTMTAALFLGLQRTAAAQFSFLLSVPVILLSTGWKALGLLEAPAAPWGQLAVAAAVAGVAAYLCIRGFLALIERIGFMPFVVYRGLLAAVLFAILLYRV